jgi:hypothetical protein
MENQRLMSELLDLAERMGLAVRHDNLGGAGSGLCQIRGRQVLFLDQDSDVDDQISALAKALADQPDLDRHFILPQIRQLLEDYRQKK